MSDTQEPATEPPAPKPRGGPGRPRGGRRPGAGAPKGNLNGLKGGEYSKQLAALKAVMRAMPSTTGLLAEVTRRDRRKLEFTGRAFHYYGDLLLALASGKPIEGLDNAHLRRLALASDPIKELTQFQIPEKVKNAIAIKQSNDAKARAAGE